MSEPFIGIDFGTCNSSAAWFDPRSGKAETLRNAEGEEKTPSVVYFGPGNEIVVGRYAEDRLESPDERQRVISAVKRNLAKKFAQVVDGRPITPLEVAALILRKIRQDAEQTHFQEPVTRAVITHPAVFDEVEKEQLRGAARRAGFREVELLEEPVAAADAYTRNGINVGRHVLIYDLGGGTFDLAWLAREEGGDEFRLAMEPRGKRIGGEDFDRAVYSHFEEAVSQQMNRPICAEGLDLDLLRRCRRVKESLSSSEESVPLAWQGHGLKLNLRLTRTSFERLVENHVDLTMRLSRSIQEDALAAGYPLESVILIGGASRTPCIIERLKKILQVEPRKWEKQDVAVALGAAYHAQRLWGNGPGPERRSSNGYPLEETPKPAGHQQAKAPEPPANPRVEPRPERDERRPCPACAEMIKIDASRCRFCGEILSKEFGSAPGETRAGAEGLASRGSRLGASLIDLIISAVAFCGAGISGDAAFHDIAAAKVAATAALLTVGGIQMHMLTRRGQTIGKRIIGLRIVEEDGENAGFVSGIVLRYAVPWLIYAIPLIIFATLPRGSPDGIYAIPSLGLVLFAIDNLSICGRERRCLHDRIAGTIVVKHATGKRIKGPRRAPHEPRADTQALASREARLGAAVIDLFIPTVAFFGVVFTISIVRNRPLYDSEGWALVAAVGLVVGGSQMHLLATRGQTIGKKILGLRIIKADGENPGFVGAFLLRTAVPWLLYAMPLMFYAVLWRSGPDSLVMITWLGVVFFLIDILFIYGEEQRCLHDRMAGTIVVKNAAGKRRPTRVNEAFDDLE